MPYVAANDGTRLYYKDWGKGQPIMFSHGWPLTSDAWDEQMFYLASKGYRCIAHDRRGHGRSDQPWHGNDMDTYADDLAAVVQALGLTQVMHVGHSTGGGEAARYVARYGNGAAEPGRGSSSAVAGLVLIGAVTPMLMQGTANPNGVPKQVFDDTRAAVLTDRTQCFLELTTTFYGANRPDAKVSQGLRDKFCQQGMQGGLKNLYDCIAAFSETDQTEDLKQIHVPTLIIHGDDDQIVPIKGSAFPSKDLLRDVQLNVYPGASHGLTATHAQQVNEDLLAFAGRLFSTKP